ncbi:MAG: hypothetical protein NTY30_03055 [Candidatus Berkelbacteria bacterium]|nr:hypothetical protein [Candidatus Berkelbacteria bacterium]
MKPIKVFKVLARRRIIIVCLVFVLVLGIGIGLGANLLQKAKKAKAVTFLANSDSLVIPENSIVYIGAGGYISQKFYTQTAESYNPAHFISSAGLTMPADRIWQTNYNGCSSVPTPTVWADTSYSNGCYSFISDGAGMILKYNKSIDIYGTVVIGDRVVFDAPNITLHSGSKIFANGQRIQRQQFGWLATGWYSGRPLCFAL